MATWTKPVLRSVRSVFLAFESTGASGTWTHIWGVLRQSGCRLLHWRCPFADEHQCCKDVSSELGDSSFVQLSSCGVCSKGTPGIQTDTPTQGFFPILKLHGYSSQTAACGQILNTAHGSLHCWMVKRKAAGWLYDMGKLCKIRMPVSLRKNFLGHCHRHSFYVMWLPFPRIEQHSTIQPASLTCSWLALDRSWLIVVLISSLVDKRESISLNRILIDLELCFEKENAVFLNQEFIYCQRNVEFKGNTWRKKWFCLRRDLSCTFLKWNIYF